MTAVPLAALVLVHALATDPQACRGDSVVAAVIARRAEMAPAIADLSYDGEYRYVEQDRRAGTTRETLCRRRVYRQGAGRQRYDFLSVSVDGRELRGRELQRAVEDLASKGAVDGDTRMPFEPGARDEYRYELLGDTQHQGQPAWVIGFEPRHASDRVVRGHGVVLKQGAEIARIEFTPARVPFVVRDMRLVLEYAPVQGYWVPVQLTMDLDLRLRALVSVLDRHVHVDDVYTRHRFNAGLDDAFFSRRIVLAQ